MSILAMIVIALIVAGGILAACVIVSRHDSGGRK